MAIPTEFRAHDDDEGGVYVLRTDHEGRTVGWHFPSPTPIQHARLLEKSGLRLENYAAVLERAIACTCIHVDDAAISNALKSDDRSAARRARGLLS